MGVFVRVVIDQGRCAGPDRDKDWMSVCPLGIFELRNGRPSVVEENEDECTLCGLCLDACKTGAVEIQKLYEE